MSLFVFKRLITLIATLVGTSVVVFLVLEVLPGNAAQILMGPDASPEAVIAMTQKLGLDRAPALRYWDWVTGMLHGDLGLSYAYSTPVVELVLERLAITVPLALMAMTLTTALALAAGIYAASRHNKLGDVGVMGLTQVGIAIPNFWFAILLILLFSVHLQWFSAGGFPGWEEGILPGLRALLLPAVSLAVVQAAILARITRSAVLEVLREDFVRTARAKGVSQRGTLWRHVLRNALIPVITVMGLQFAELLAGTIVVESVFYLPGLGRLIFQSISNRDLIVVRNCVMLLAAMVVVVNFVVDLLYAAIDPRVKASDMSAILPVAPLAPPGGPGFWQRALRNPSFVIGLVLSVLLVLAAGLSLVWTPHDPYEIDMALKLKAPGGSYWLGTDPFGRDIVSLLLVGARASIVVGVVAVGIGLLVGTSLGLLASARRGWLEEAIMRLCDFGFAFPAILSAIMLTAVFGPGMVIAIIAIGLYNIPTFARITRASANAVWGREFVLAARACGKGTFAITVEHVLPNILSVLIVQSTIRFAIAILAEAALSYLGLGTQPPQPSWGRMLSEAQTLLFQAPRLAVFPGIAIAFAVLGLNLLGDGLRDLFDPRLARKR